MRAHLPLRFAVLSLLLASTVQGRGLDDKVVIRTLDISERPADATHNIYVSGQVTTVLRFEHDIDPARTQFMGWEGRLEPLLMGNKKVVLEPLRDLGEEVGLPLLVTLTDGTTIPFLVRPPRREPGGWTDHQVNVFKSGNSYNAVLSSLHDSVKRERELSEENRRLKAEENSVDHALATLLANGEVKKTPFRRVKTFRPKNQDMEMVVELFSGPGKAAAVVRLTNTYYGGPWTFDAAYLTSDLTVYTRRPFALRMNRAEIVPGQSGRLAVVVDKSAFDSHEGLVDLALQIFRGDGLLQVAVEMEHTLVQQ